MKHRSYCIRHVLMTADAVGGVWTYCLDLAKELAQLGVRVTLTVMGPGPSETQVAAAKSIPELELHIGNFKLEWMEEPWRDVDAASHWLLALADRTKPDLVHLNGYCHAALPWRCPTMVVCHSDVASWFGAVKGQRLPDNWREYHRRVRNGLSAAGMVVAPTGAVLREVQGHYGSLENTRVIYNGRQLALAHSAEETFVVAAGRVWDEAKNIAALASVAPNLLWPVYVAGAGEATPGVHHLGQLPPEQMLDWMRRASIYALPAKYEPFGLSILEAAASECALVLGDIPSLRELWDGAAVFVDPTDVKALEIGINYLIRNDSVRKQLAKAAAERARLYSARAFGCGYLFAYQDLLQAEVHAPLERGYAYADYPVNSDLGIKP